MSFDISLIGCIIVNMKDLETQLKDAIKRSGLSQYQLARLSGVNQAQISYFLSGQRNLTLSSASKLAKVLGLELKPKARKKRK